MIGKQIEAIIKACERKENGEQYQEVGVWLNGYDESVNFIVDNHFFEYEVNETHLYVRYNGGEDDDPVMYNHVFNIARIDYITDEV